MHKKKRNGRVMLYRSRYVQKVVEDNAHGYAVQEFVGSLPVDASEIPDVLAMKLSPTELAFVMACCVKRETRNAR